MQKYIHKRYNKNKNVEKCLICLMPFFMICHHIIDAFFTLESLIFKTVFVSINSYVYFLIKFINFIINSNI